jgi:hypothetical protein
MLISKQNFNLYQINIQHSFTGQRKEIYLLSTAFSDIAYAGSPDSPSGVIGVYFATM